MRRILAALAFALLWTTPLRAAEFGGPGHDWRALRTENFEVVFHEGERFLALKAAVAAEEAYAQLVPRLLYRPKGIIRIVLVDNVDDSNGFSQQQPWNTIRIFVTRPHSEDRLDYYDEWMRTIVSHELTHAIHLDTVRAIPKFMRAVFGRTYFIHHVQPIFMVEGLAVHEETRLTTKGRNRSPLSEMMLRAASLEGEFPHIDQAATWTREWPAGAIQYIFGGAFHQFLAERYGEESLGEYSLKHAGQIWPFLFNHNAKLIFGKPVTNLWEEFRRESIARHMETYDRLNALGLTDPQIRTENGGLHARPAWIDNETFLVEERSQDRKPRILSVNTATSRVRTFLRTERLAGLAAMPGSSSVVFSQIAEDDPYSDTYDLFVYNTETGRKRRLTKGERLRDPAPFPDGGSVVAVAQEYSKTWLARVWLEDGRVEPLMNPDAFGFDAQFSEPSVSPDGKSIAVSIWHDDGNRDIFLYALDERRFHRLTADPGQDQDPNYSADGRTLYFVSDRTGVSNVYALNLASRELTQVTNVLTGAFWPTPNPDETSLAFIHYAARGYDAATLPLARSFGKHFPPETIAENAVVTGPVTAAMNKKSGELAAEERKYSAWPTILPSYWNPVYSTSVIQGEQVSALGIQTSGYDSVYRHAWSLLVTHRFDRGFTGGAVSYAYNRFKPALRVSASRVGLDYGNIAEDPTGNTHAFFLKRNAFAGGASWPVTDHLSFFGNFVAQRFIADTTVDAPRNHLPEDGWFMGPRVGAVFVNTESYAMSIAPENGGAYVLSAAFDNSAFGSDYDMAVGLASAEQWISLPWYNNVLDLQLKGAFAQGDDLYRTPVRVGGFVQEDLTAQTSTNSFALRGYESGALLGERAVVGSADYRTPIWYQQRGLGTWPIFFDTLSASIFADAAKVWSGELDLEDPGRIWESYGLELYQSLGVGYYFGFTLRYAFAFTPGFDDPDSHFIAAGALF